MSKIKKTKKKYAQHRVYEDTADKLSKLSKKTGQYSIEILKELVDDKYILLFMDKSEDFQDF